MDLSTLPTVLWKIPFLNTLKDSETSNIQGDSHGSTWGFHIRMFITVLFIMTEKKWKEPRSPTTRHWVSNPDSVHWTAATENNECTHIHQYWGTVTTPLRKTVGCQVYGQSDTIENNIHRFGKRMYVKHIYKNVNCITLEYVNYGQWLFYSLVHFWVGRCLLFIEQKLFYWLEVINNIGATIKNCILKHT